jgi:endonuclease/exonuclease/phosphatase family metal-dependent hydrolase
MALAEKGPKEACMKGFASRPALVAAAVFFILGCNPCNDTDRVVLNVNDHAFAGPEFTVVTFNLLHGFGDAVNDATLDDRLNIVAQEVIATLPDAVLFQEASVTLPGTHCNVIGTLVDRVNTALSAEGKGYNRVYARSNGSADLIGFEEGSAILSLHEILSSDVTIYQHNPSSLPEFRIALRVTLRGQSGDIDLFGTHLTNREDMEGSELVRTLQSRELAEVIIPGRGNTNPVVVGGDFNDPPGTDTIVEMTDAGAVDMFVEGNPGMPGYTSFGKPFDITDPAEEPYKRIDYLFFIDEGGEITGSERFLDTARDIDPGPGESWLWASDHVGVWATFRPSGY